LTAPLRDAAQGKAITDVLAAAIRVTHQDLVAVRTLLALEPDLDVEEQRRVPVVEELLGVLEEGPRGGEELLHEDY
jgi:hypothetical protein